MLPTESTQDEQSVYCAQAGDLVLVREARWRVTHVRASMTAARQAQRHAPPPPPTPPLTTPPLATRPSPTQPSPTPPLPTQRSPKQPVRVVTLRGADRENCWQERTLLEPFDRVAPWPTPTTPRIVSRRRWMRALGTLAASTGAGLNKAWPEGVLAVAEANVTLLAYQVSPLLAILQGVASRVLIADGVGLGKTVQAALVLRALAARGRATRVLIAVPAGLRDQWQQELRERVGLAAEVIDAATLAARVRQLPSDVNPWTRSGIVIASLDFLKQSVVLHGLSAIDWDALIVDEAHALTTGTDRAAAAHLLAQHSRVVLLLTATPHAGSDAAFDALCRIGQLVDHDRNAGADNGSPGPDPIASSVRDATAVSRSDSIASSRLDPVASSGPDPIAIFRRTRGRLGRADARRERVLRVRPTRIEQRLHALLARYVTRVEREQHAGEHYSGESATLAMSVLQKRATSSAWSLLRSLERRVELLSREGAADEADEQSAPREQTRLPFEQDMATEAPASLPVREDLARDVGAAVDSDPAGETDAADEEPLAVLSAPGLANVRVERAWLTLLIQIARRAAHHESKLHALQRLVRRVRESAIIYTEYRDTLAHVVDTLPRERTLSTTILHGGLTREARTGALRDFSNGDATLLCATDAGGEGLNLHQRCRLVINVELPWNPNRLEQRIGRVDRLGQSRTVHAIHFVLAGTSEEAILETLNARVDSIATALGERPESSGPTASVPAPPVSPGRQRPERLWPDLSTEADAVVRALEYVRALRASPGGDEPSGERNGKPSFDLELEGGAPWIATVRRQRRGPLADLTPGLLCIWRTRIRCADAASDTARELITPLHVPRLHGPPLHVHRLAARWREWWQRFLESDEYNLMQRRLDAFVRSTIAAWNERERAFQQRAEARDAAISRALHTMWARLDAQRQPLLFADIAADREARQPAHWRAPPPGVRPMLSQASSEPSAASSGPGAASSGPGAASSGPGVASLGPCAASSGPGVASSESAALSSRACAESSGRGATSLGPGADVDHELLLMLVLR